MTRAEKASIAYQLVAHGPRVMGGDAVLSDDDFKFWNINYDFVAGYGQAEKDLNIDIVDAFIAGAEWQKKHSPLPEDTVLFHKGVEEGKRLMMEDAARRK